MSGRALLERGVHVAVLWSLAVAQPLFELLDRDPDFFAARGTPPGDIVAFALTVTFAVPLALIAVQWLAALASPGLARVLHLACVAGLTAAIALQLIGLSAAVPALAVAVGLAALGTLAYVRLPAARTLLTVLAPAPVVLLVLFLPGSVDVQAAHGRAAAPVVMVVLDELPVHSLMAADGTVDERRYPNFARLAADATWYRDTASVDQDTPYAVPAILDGRLPRRDRLPVAADHPQSVFSLLGSRYQLHVTEEATTLCAPTLCTGAARPGFGDRMDALWDDLSLAYAHEVLPEDLEPETRVGISSAVAETRRARRETKRERFLRIHANLARGRVGRFADFVAGIEGGRQPRLHLIHILLPHVPFQYLPSGRHYRRSPRQALPGIEGRPGFGIPFVVDQGYQRHLLQLGATDRLLGRLLDRLQEVGIYDRALVVLVADHGVSFQVGHERRLLRRGNVQDIAPVPFFLKAPGQRRGRISDRPLQTIDVLPTMADLLDVRIPWRVDGRSALAPEAPGRRRTIIAKKFRRMYLVDTPGYARAKQATLARKLRLFGGGLYAFGPRPDLLGRRAPAGGRVLTVHPDSGFVPAHLTGTIRGDAPAVAVAVNGRVVATGATFSLPGAERLQYSVMLPEQALRPGRNSVRVLVP